MGKKRTPVDLDVMLPEAIGERLRLTRMALGYTQSFIAQLCGMSVQAWNNNESGRDRISFEPAARVCIATGCDLDWIYRGQLDGITRDLANAIRDYQQRERTERLVKITRAQHPRRQKRSAR